MKSTELSKSMRRLTEEVVKPTIKWTIVRKVCSKTRSNYSKLCLTEKCFIIQSLDDTNKQSEVINKRWNQDKLL